MDNEPESDDTRKRKARKTGAGIAMGIVFGIAIGIVLGAALGAARSRKD